MSLISYIEHLKTKPEHVRRRVAFWSSLGTTGLIFLFWLGTYTAVGTPKNAAIAQQQVDRAETPTQTLTASVGHFFTDIRDMIFTPKKIEYKPIEVVPGKY